ncbi:MAG: potassium-transporting ATPase subunit KdpC [Polyangiaceae bacterium]|nr:potassium-transporting ATPase subunit KdpC [Polyangiaceae bacterium]
MNRFYALRPTLVLLGIFTLLTGVIYPLSVTAVAHAAFPKQAHGSLVQRDGKVVGSDLIGQPFADPKYFWSRPSATTPFEYNAGSSSASNLGPSNPALRQRVEERIAALRAADPENLDPIPIDLVTTSASGLDPHISPAAALYQVSRVAKARGLAPDRVTQLVYTFVKRPALGLLGAPHVNVLHLNLALDSMVENQPSTK